MTIWTNPWGCPWSRTCARLARPPLADHREGVGRLASRPFAEAEFRLSREPSIRGSHDQASLSSDRRRLASLFKMMDVSRHKSVDTLRGYVRDADAFRDHAGAGLL
jgi:hypothetical protein